MFEPFMRCVLSGLVGLTWSVASKTDRLRGGNQNGAMTMVDDDTAPVPEPPGHWPSRFLLRVVLAISSLLTVISITVAAYYIPYLRVYPVCTDIVKDEEFVFEVDMPRYFAELYVGELVVHGKSIRYDREKRIIRVAPANYDIFDFANSTHGVVRKLLKEQGDAPSDKLQRNTDNLWKGKPVWLWPDCDLVKRVASRP